MSGDRLLEFAVVGSPDLDQLVSAGGGQPLTIGTELHSGHGFGVTS